MLSTWIKTAQFRTTRADNAIVPSEPEPLGSLGEGGMSHICCYPMSRAKRETRRTAGVSARVIQSTRAKRVILDNVPAYLKLRSNLGGAQRNQICRVVRCSEKHFYLIYAKEQERGHTLTRFLCIQYRAPLVSASIFLVEPSTSHEAVLGWLLLFLPRQKRELLLHRT